MNIHHSHWSINGAKNYNQSKTFNNSYLVSIIQKLTVILEPIVFQIKPSMIITSLAKPPRNSHNTRNKVSDQFFEMLQLTCHLCAHLYNSTDRTPLSVCPEQHTYCNQCLSELFSHHPNGTRCPTCRNPIWQKAIRINKTILRLSDAIPEVAQKIANLQSEKKCLEQNIAYLQLKNAEQKRNKQEDKENKSHHINQFNGLPIINPNELNKYKKININAFITRNRRNTSASSKKANHIRLGLLQPLKRY